MLAAWGLYASLGAWCVFHLFRQDALVARTIVPILLILPIALSLVHRTQEVNRRVPSIIGAAPVESYYEASFDIYPLVRFINEETPTDSGVVMLEPRVFYIERPYIIWYPFPTEPTYDWPDLEPVELLHRWQSENMGYVLVTYGPNYRALSIAYADGLPDASPGLSDFITDLPDWVKLRATYAENVIGFHDMGDLTTIPNWQDERSTDIFDVRSIQIIYELERLGYLKPAFQDPRSGIVFQIVYPEDVQ